MAPDFDTWQRGIRRASCRIFAAFCLVLAALQSRALLTTPVDFRGTGVTALGVLVLLIAAYRAWRTLLDTRDAWVFTLLVTAVAADPVAMTRHGVGGDANPAFFLLAATFLAFIVTLRGLAVPVAITATTAVYVTVSVISGGRMLVNVLDESVILATSQVSVWMLFLQLANEAVRADDAHRRSIAEQAAAARSSAEQGARIAAQRTLHDRVLAALILLSSRTPNRGAVRAECRRAARAVASLGGDGPPADSPVDGTQLRGRLETEAASASASTGVAVRIRHTDELLTVVVPARVAEAVCEAVAESLRNVGRHAGVWHADVNLSVAGDAGLLIEILDRGRGIQQGFAPGFGLHQSVFARMHEVGGEASVEVRPGGGTCVALRWLPPPTPVTAPVGASAPELGRIPRNPRLFAAAFSAVLLVGALYLAARYPTDDGSRWTDAMLCLGVVAYLAWCVLAVPRPVALRYAHQAGFLVLPGLLALGLHTAGNGSLLSFDSWVVGLAGIPVILLAMVRPARSVLALAGLESCVVTVAAVLDPTLSPLEVLSPITQTPMFVGLVVYGVSAIARVRRAADAHELALLSALAQREEIAARERALGWHHAWLGREVRPFLEEVAAAQLDPGDRDVQQRAGVLAHAVRDELAAPAQLAEPLRRHIESARVRGIRVRVRASDGCSPTAEHGELEQLMALLSTSDGVTDITVSLPHAATPHPRVVVRPRLSGLQHSAALNLLGDQLLDIDDDDLASIITLYPGQREDR